MICTNRYVSKGAIGEKCLLQWFQTNNISFFPIEQTPHTFAKAFTHTIKRPDFLVLLPYIGTIAVDAKNYQFAQGGFTIGETELNKALRFEMVTRMPFWFAYLHKHEIGQEWYWINAVKVLHTGTLKQNRTTHEGFYAIDINNFTPVRARADFGQIFSIDIN